MEATFAPDRHFFQLRKSALALTGVPQRVSSGSIGHHDRNRLAFAGLVGDFLAQQDLLFALNFEDVRFGPEPKREMIYSKFPLASRPKR